MTLSILACGCFLDAEPELRLMVEYVFNVLDAPGICTVQCTRK